MTRAELAFTRIEIRRMPGFPRGGLELADLCPGVNIIYGPNASGKTTLSRAIERLLSHGGANSRDGSLFAVLVVGGQRVTIDYQLGHVRCQRDGVDADLSTWIPADVKNHYVLALHDLIRSEDGHDLAAAILRESAGGYDLAAARQQLGLKDRAAGKGTATRDLDIAVRDYREALGKQDDLALRESRRQELHGRRDEARAAEDRCRWLTQTIEYLDARDASQQAQEAVHGFPAGVAQLKGTELDDLDRLRNSLQEMTTERDKEKARLEDATQRLAKCRLPEAGIAPELVGQLRLKCQQLRDSAVKVRTARTDYRSAVAALATASQSLGPGIEGQRIRPPTLETVRQLAEFAHRAERLRAEIASAEALHDWLQSAPDATIEDCSTLNRGLWILQQWLAGSAGRPAAMLFGGRGAIVAGCLTAVVALGMGFLVHPSWFVLLLVAATLLAWPFLPTRSSRAREDLHSPFESLAIGQPDAWTPAAVRALIEQLQRRHAVAALAQEKATRWDSLEPRRRELAQRRQLIEQEKADWLDTLGIAEDPATVDEAWLYALAATAHRVHQAEQHLAAARTGVREAVREYRALRDTVRVAIRDYGYTDGGDADMLSSQVEQLDNRRQEHRRARDQIVLSRARLEELDERIKQCEHERQTLLEGLGLDRGEEPILREWMHQHQDYLEASEALRHARRDLDRTRRALAEHPELMDLTRQEVLDEQQRCEQLAAQIESTSKELGAIEEAIAAARESTDLEGKLARKTACEEALRELRAQDYDAVVGNVLADRLGHRQRDHERPAVFRHAQRLFADITRGRYRLDIEGGEPPRFRAFDTEREVGLSLDALSSGTRLQLLLAVRIAFVEHQEQGPRLPLVLDETLGNSDEQRARQIINAALVICGKGRQIFYLTAQHDEVGKWQTVIRENGSVPNTLIDLATMRGLDQADRCPPLVDPPPALPAFPPPLADEDWHAYGQRLQVPRLSPWDEPGSIHLWYLIDDVAALYRLLRSGITRWGQLQMLATYAEDDALRPDSTVYRCAEAAAKVIAHVVTCWRQGRGRPVDRQVLEQSGAVSGVYIDRVADLAAGLSGDAKALIDALDGGQVRRFHAEKRAALRDYLLAHGYLDEQQILTADQIRQELLPAVFSELDSGLLSRDRVEQLLAAVLAAGAQ